MDVKMLESLKITVKNDVIKEQGEKYYNDLITEKIKWLSEIKITMESVFKRDNNLFKDEVIKATIEKNTALEEGLQLFELAIVSTSLDVFCDMKLV